MPLPGRSDAANAHHSRVHVIEQMAVKCPVAECIGSQVENYLATGLDHNGMLAGRVVVMARDEFEEMAMKMNRMVHHRIVDQVNTHPLSLDKRDWGMVIGQPHAVERPHVPFHVSGQVDVERSAGRAHMGIAVDGHEVAVGQNLMPTSPSPCPG